MHKKSGFTYSLGCSLIPQARESFHLGVSQSGITAWGLLIFRVE